MAVATAPSRRVAATGSVRVRKVTDAIATVVLWVMASSIIVMLAAFIIYMVYLGWSALTPSFVFGKPLEHAAGGGVGPEIYNSFYILILTLLFTIPIAVSAGIYLQEYALPGTFRSIVQFSAESLATVPSIVMGLFGLLIFVYTFHWGYTALGGALTLTLLNLPALVRVTQEALASVPDRPADDRRRADRRAHLRRDGRADLYRRSERHRKPAVRPEPVPHRGDAGGPPVVHAF
jgi:ABC-type phosphate transport system permease subunit